MYELVLPLAAMAASPWWMVLGGLFSVAVLIFFLVKALAE